MTTGFLILLAVYMALLMAVTRPMGAWLVAAVEGRLSRGPLGSLERRLYHLCGVHRAQGMTWKTYALAVMLFSGMGFLALYALQRLQAWLPLNPQALGNVSPDSAFNTAVSFVTNTNWQGYGGETTMSYLTQMLGLTVQNYVSAAAGVAVAFALMRGLARKQSTDLGNFWVDLTRITLYVLLPLSTVLSLALVSQGVVQNLRPYVIAKPLDTAQAGQVIAMGPAASQVAIKQLGTNGGGFFNVNSSHPLENPTWLSNFLEVFAILLIPAGLCHAFGRMVNDRRQGRAVFAAMALIFVSATLAAGYFEQQGNPAFAAANVDMAASAEQSGGNMEGKEARFGIGNSALWAVATTAASNGSVNSMHDSYTPLGGMISMWLMQLGEVVFGGVGSGLYGMLVFAIIAVFVAGLMIGRTPEYLGKKIEPFEMKMASIVILLTPLLVLLGSALAVSTESGRATIFNPGAHGFSEVLYALSSAANNNGSAFAGLGANTPFYNTLLGIAMWFGRFAVIVPVLALAGLLAAKKTVASSAGTLPTHGPLFVALLASTVLVVGSLTYLPVLALGPIVEHLMLAAI